MENRNMFKELRAAGLNTDNTFYTIAEIGINHSGNINKAKKLIDAAKESGADSVKFQTYRTEKRTTIGSPIYDILKKCELSFDEFSILKRYSKDKDIDFFSTPFDEESVDFLADIGCDLFKVASFDVTNHKLLRKIASKNIPTILSLGMATIEEARSAYSILSKRGSFSKVSLMHCVSSYPTKPEDSNLLGINTIKRAFEQTIVGQSDHTPGIEVPIIAATMGAQILENHFMLDGDTECADASVSITPDQMSLLTLSLRNIEKVLGKGVLKLDDSQSSSSQFRRRSV